ncbi:MAG: GDSL-type esterase/lipase family protein [Paludibacter sp.]|jgi:alpha-L-fucosidase 2|nr:hypothetical protein [Paludibacteraceae bacterium]MBP6355966.1 hypothetical protein [Paludibacter sp.]MDX9919476.1 GDSL-type esterase/lipase family protein [Paludibacter sp.]
MKKITFFALLALLMISCTHKPTRIVCIGDSITEGAGIFQQNKYSYPARLDSLLGESFQVLNSGKGGTTLQKEGDFSYWNTKEFANIFAFEPDMVVIKLGTNDTKPQNWNSARFEADYQTLIDTLKSLPNAPEIIMCIPVPVFATQWGINDSTLNAGVIPVIKQIAKKNKIELIDLNTPLRDRHDLFPDHIHPNEEGTKEMAQIIAGFIKK